MRGGKKTKTNYLRWILKGGNKHQSNISLVYSFRQNITTNIKECHLLPATLSA